MRPNASERGCLPSSTLVIVASFAIAFMMITIMLGTSVLTARPNEVSVASPQLSSLESKLDAMGVRDARAQPAGGGALVSFTYNGQFYNFQVVSADGGISVTDIPRLVSQSGSGAHLAAPRASGGAESAVSTGAVSGGPAMPCCQGGGGGPKAYSVYFDESGLPSGASWNVTIKDGSSYFFISDTTLDYEYDVFVNGTYSYQAISSAGEYGYYTKEGSFTVNGGPVTIDISFTQVTSDPSGLSEACIIAIFITVGLTGVLVALLVACYTTGVGCIALYYFVTFYDVVVPAIITLACGAI